MVPNNLVCNYMYSTHESRHYNIFSCVAVLKFEIFTRLLQYKTGGGGCGPILSRPSFSFIHVGSSGCRVVKLLACGARVTGFDSRPRHLDFQRLVISCFQVEIWLKDR